jgi:hypothetical protein
MDIVVEWWHEFYNAPAPIPFSSLLLSSLITPFVAVYLAIVPAYLGHTRLNRAGLMTCIEVLMAVLWGASSISSAVYISQRVCFGQVCNMAKAAVVIGFFQWCVFSSALETNLFLTSLKGSDLCLLLGFLSCLPFAHFDGLVRRLTLEGVTSTRSTNSCASHGVSNRSSIALTWHSYRP